MENVTKDFGNSEKGSGLPEGGPYDGEFGPEARTRMGR